MRILVAEDDGALRAMVTKRLRNQGYGVVACGNGLEASEQLEGAEFDCVVLDIMLPGRDGLTIVRELRGRGDATPVLLLTARDSVEDRVSGLDAGADDYVVKPFSFDELDARVRALLRRGASERNPILKVADLELDTVRHAVRRAGKTIDLTSKEYSLLEYLMRHQDRVLTRAQIINHVWDYDFEGDSNIVDVYIRYLRRKMDRGFDPPLIHTVRGTGYVLRIDP